MVTDIGLIAAAISIGMTGIASAYAEANIGSASIGVMAEKPQEFGKLMLMTVIPESIVIFGMVVSLIILFVV